MSSRGGIPRKICRRDQGNERLQEKSRRNFEPRMRVGGFEPRMDTNAGGGFEPRMDTNAGGGFEPRMDTNG
ncbi:MAG: hypothetical protein ACK5AN_19980, partial [Planctomyces sp.]